MARITSIHGRRLGLDENNGLVYNPKRSGYRVAGTSDSTGTTLANNGFVSVTSTTDDTWKLADPFKGAVVTLMCISTSTGIHSINLNNSVAYSTVGTASSTAVLTGYGASLTLFGLTTAVWMPIGRAGSSASAYLSS